MSALEIAGLIISAFLAGAINAVAGGGTLVTFPTLLFFGTPSVIANATSTLALVVGTSGSIYGFRRHYAAVKELLRRFLAISIIGGFLGAVMLTYTNEKVFSKLVPFLILFATILFLCQGVVRRFVNRNATVAPRSAATDGSRPIWGAMLFQFLVAVYGGYFGAGIGILMLATFAFMGLEDINEMNTLKTILGSLINLVATIWFIISGLIHWPKAMVMIVGSMAGYFVGAHYSQRIEPKRVRQIITAIGFILSAVTFYEEFLR